MPGTTHPASLNLTLPALLQKKNASALPKVGRDADERELRNVQWQASSNTSSFSGFPGSTITPTFLDQGNYSFLHTPVKPANFTPGFNTYPGPNNSYVPGGTKTYVPGGNNNNPDGLNYSTGSINTNLGQTNNYTPGLGWGSNTKTNPYDNYPNSNMIFSASLPNLSTLDTESLNGFLEQCQQQGLTDDQIIHQISENIKYLIRTKLKGNPAPGYNIAQNRA